MPVPIIVSAVVVSGSLVVYTSLRRCLSPPDFDQEPDISLEFVLDSGRPHPHAPIRRRMWGSGRQSRATNRRQDNVSGLGSSSAFETPNILGDRWEVDFGPDSFPLNTISEWAARTEGELDEILRRSEDHNNSGTGQSQRLAVPPSSSVRFGSSRDDDLSELGSPSPTNFLSPEPPPPPSLFHP